MKTRLKSMSKRSFAVFLGVLMLISSIGLSANAYYWDNGTWYLKSDIDSWGTGILMTNNSSNDDQAYTDIYLFGSSSNSNFNFKFKEEDSDNTSWFGPSSGSDTACGTSGTAGGETLRGSVPGLAGADNGAAESDCHAAGQAAGRDQAGRESCVIRRR